MHRAAGGIGKGPDHRGHVLELPVEGVVRVVPAAAATAPVERMHPRVRLQQGQDRAPPGVLGRGAVHEYQRRAIAAGPVADRDAVGGGDGV
jgi:hypothetical protein